jgi:hypothetical protein
MSTATQSRLLTLARYHKGSRGRWPTQTVELLHHAVTPAHALSLYALRPGYGYCVAWISNGLDGVNYYADEADARAYIRRAVHDLEAQDPI